MEKRIKKLNTVRYNLCMLYALNISDWLCTIILLKTGYFFEFNPIMSGIMDNTMLCFLLKIVVPFVILALVLTNIHIMPLKSLRVINVLVYVMLGVYSLINLWHIFNFLILMSF